MSTHVKADKPHVIRSVLPGLLLIEGDEIRVLRWVCERRRDVMTFPGDMAESLAGIARRRLRMLGLIRIVVPAGEKQEAYYEATPAGRSAMDDVPRGTP